MLCQFYSGTVFLYICVYVTVLFIEEKRKRKKKMEKNEFVLHELTKAVLKLHSTKWSAKFWGALIQRLCSFLAASGGF